MKESCSILEPTTAKNGGTASCRSAVFFGLEEDVRGRERESGRMGEDERGRKRTLRGGKRTERRGNGLGGRRNGTLRRTGTGL